MKVKKRILTMMLLIMLTMSNIFADESNTTTIDNVKDFYTETINDSNWKTLSRDERLEALRIDAKALNLLSTEQLIDLILAHPFSIDMLLFSDAQEGFNSVLADSEILQEIVKREDVNNATRSRARALKFLNDKEDNFVTNSIQDVVLFGLFNQNKISVQTLVDFQTMKNTNNMQSMYIITIEDSQIINPLEINPLSVISYYNTTVTTPKGSKVAALAFNGTDFTVAEKNALNKNVKSSYPNVTLVSDATLKYNCHSYSFYSTSTSNNRWINYPSSYITDGSFSKTSTVRVNHRVTYAKNHSAIIVGVGNTGMGNIKVKSKWGQAGVYNHFYNDSPYGSLSGTYTP